MTKYSIIIYDKFFGSGIFICYIFFRNKNNSGRIEYKDK